ncbi:hypothetical protein Bpfe_023886, partial [Biomphalaria pfeifferi]
LFNELYNCELSNLLSHCGRNFTIYARYITDILQQPVRSNFGCWDNRPVPAI